MVRCHLSKGRPPISSRLTPDWALAYLRGRAKGFAKGNVPWAAVQTAINLAQRDGATAEEIASAVAHAGSKLSMPSTCRALRALKRC